MGAATKLCRNLALLALVAAVLMVTARDCAAAQCVAPGPCIINATTTNTTSTTHTHRRDTRAGSAARAESPSAFGARALQRNKSVIEQWIDDACLRQMGAKVCLVFALAGCIDDQPQMIAKADSEGLVLWPQNAVEKYLNVPQVLF